MLQATFCPFVGEFNATESGLRGLEPERGFQPRSFVERILYRRTLLRRQVQTHCVRARAQTLF